MTDQAAGGPSLEERFAGLNKALESASLEIEDASEVIQTRDSAEEANRRRMGRDRSGIAMAIIGVYVVAVVSACSFVFFWWPSCEINADVLASTLKDLNPGTPAESVKVPNFCSAEKIAEIWNARVDYLRDILTIAVLPIVTLMLGFYFGTESTSRGNNGDEIA